MPFTEPLGIFFSPLSPGYAVATYGGRSVKGLFRSTYASAGVGTVGIEAASPGFDCRTADVPDVAHGDTLVIDGTSYTVRGVQPDEAGIVHLVLEAP